MTKSIEQIALEAGITPEQLNQCLAKIGEGLEPVASFVVGDATAKFGSKRDLVEHTNDDTGYWKSRGYYLELLYATPHEVIIAAEQRVAEACAKYVVSGDHDDDPYSIASKINSGEWRKYP